MAFISISLLLDEKDLQISKVLLFLGELLFEEFNFLQKSILVVSECNRSLDFIIDCILHFLLNFGFQFIENSNEFILILCPVLASSSSEIFEFQIALIIIDMARSDFFISSCLSREIDINCILRRINQIVLHLH